MSAGIHGASNDQCSALRRVSIQNKMKSQQVAYKTK